MGDAEFFAQSRTLIPALVAELKASRARVAELEAECDRLEQHIQKVWTPA